MAGPTEADLPAPSRHARPAGGGERIPSIDILRGLALFGVLAINLDTEFRVTFFEQFLSDPQGRIDIWMPDRIVQLFLSWVLEFKAITLFSFLFGVGLAIQFDRLAGDPRRLILLVRRLLALLAFGLVHLFLIWNGDILTEYAIAGLIALPLLYAPRWLLVGVIVACLASYIVMPWPWFLSFPDQAWLLHHGEEARRVYGAGSFGEILAYRMSEVPMIVPVHIAIFRRTLGLILLGVLIWRTGILRHLSERKSLLAISGTAALVVGALMTAVVKDASPISLSLPESWLIAADWFGPIMLAGAYACLVFWASVTAPGRSLLGFAAPVGQMAFSNYIAQSVVLGLIFYGYGLGLLGRLGAAGGLAIAVALYAIQAWASASWLRSHPFGPLEWLWRTIMYGERQPWRRKSRGAA